MKSLRELYRIGKGPSSSHTMGPQKAAQIFASHHPEAKSFEVTLYGSLAATGRGHMTDVAIREVLEATAPLKIVWQPSITLPFHPNGMKFISFDEDGDKTDEWIVYSIGGGALSEGTEERWVENSKARGTFVGMTMDTTRADMTQAVLEGVAFALISNAYSPIRVTPFGMVTSVKPVQSENAPSPMSKIPTSHCIF